MKNRRSEEIVFRTKLISSNIFEQKFDKFELAGIDARFKKLKKFYCFVNETETIYKMDSVLNRNYYYYYYYY